MACSDGSGAHRDMQLEPAAGAPAEADVFGTQPSDDPHA